MLPFSLASGDGAWHAYDQYMWTFWQ